MRTLFADTSALFAFLVRDDRMHPAARQTFETFTATGVRLLTSSYVLLESIALLQSRVGLPAVQDFVSRIVPLLDVIWVDAEWHLRATQRLIGEGKRDVSLVDCLSFEIMETRGIDTAFSFDRHFLERGFEITGHEQER